MVGESVLFHQAVGEKVGLHVTDLRCLDLLLSAGPVTAGRIAEWTGLSTGSVTAVIDRLERAGYVRRARDPHDRRRVLVEPIAATALREVGPWFESMGAAMQELASRYSPEELERFITFVRQCSEITRTERQRLRGSAG